MLSCFKNCLSLSEKKDSHGKKEGKSTNIRVLIGSHPHPFSLQERTTRGSTYQCNGCQQPGYGPYYLCTDNSCSFHYHKHCGEILRHNAPFHGNHRPYPIGRYNFEEGAPNKVRDCVACGDQVRGLRYRVWRGRLYPHLNNRVFHPLCTLLPPKIEDPGESKITLELKKRIAGNCSMCNGKAKGWAYNSTCGNYCYHVGCVKNRIMQNGQQDEASENGGTQRRIVIHVEIPSPQIRKVAEVAILLIIKALFGVLDITDIFTVLFT
ncbi:uncharacterized protein LOC120296396 [Eucalyptus grandis]|uniref:Uncharacterized protein n=2 Tax=Eucalyptus grandis TaxID=71139 RepID=A0ACC3K822_EUCGR|nr:uncharacterized protein LOC120296396 [Eucalyptus grandis]KAK3422476.1 hypothetical protein EUGRSUZ_G02927 [Eucalyptus grandis]